MKNNPHIESGRLYQTLKQHLAFIADALKTKIELRTMPFEVTMPVEVYQFQDVLRSKGYNLGVTAKGYDAFWQLKEKFDQDEATITDMMHQIMEDKHTYIRTDVGKQLLKEVLFRCLEYFKETAHTLDVMLAQQQLKSPKQYDYPYIK